jgi:hypothetical protein
MTSVVTQAQAQGIPYACGFEDDEDLSNWVMIHRYSAHAQDQWVVGSAVRCEGKKSMYISADGTNAVYGSQPNIAVSYLTFKFPDSNTQQNYDISFDWKCSGDSLNSKLYVMVCPEQLLYDESVNNYYDLNKIASSVSGILNRNVAAACEPLGLSRAPFLFSSKEWQNVSLSNELRVSPSRSRIPFAIVFIWVNNNTNQELQQTGICIDNVQIGSATIKKPQNVVVEPICEDSSMLVSWESGASEFEVQYRTVGSSTWRRADGLTDGVEGFTRTNGTQCSYILQRIKEGSYDVRVQAKAAGIVSNWTYENLILVYCPENHCLNYLSFDSPDVVCTYGMTYNGGKGTPFDNVGWIDFGPDSKESRHTLHVDPTEVDPRTDSSLHTVPQGALASVRLGNWDTGYEAEGITYSFVVDGQNQGILIIKYAVVLNKPNTSCGDPGFKMVVLDENGDMIDESCGKADFTYTSAAAAGWNETKDGNIVWKDWTTVGVNLQPYDGQKVSVQLTTEDCGGGGHFGYAYFTLDCANAKLETENCGNDAKIECFAPEGFGYKWFNEAGEVVSTERTLSVDPSMQTYTCRVSFIEDTTCYFEVSTISAPRFPVPQYTWEPIYEECLSKLKFKNTSHVMTKYTGSENHTQEPTTDCHWYFTRLSDGVTTESYNWAPVYTCPMAGDTIIVNYTTYIGVDNACDSSRVDTIVVPNIIPQHTEFHMVTCPEEPVQFGNEWFNTDTTVVHLFPNFAGCDSTSTLHLKVHPTIADTYRHDSICSDSSILINGVRYREPMDNQLIMLQSVNGCDSALYMTLTVNKLIKTEMVEDQYTCADDEELFIYFNIIEGIYDSIAIDFSTPLLRDTVIYEPNLSTIAIPMPADVLPGYYTATLSFYQFCCGVHTEQYAITIRYRSSIVEQKWNDVLTLLSPNHNGGFTFTAFQWYKDGVAMPGETHSYLYQPLDMNATYYVELTRTDGVIVTTCPIQPTLHIDKTEFPTLVQSGQQIPIRTPQPVTAWLYTITGQLYSTHALPQGQVAMPAPTQPGVYVLKVVDNNGETIAKQIIVE